MNKEVQTLCGGGSTAAAFASNTHQHKGKGNKRHSDLHLEQAGSDDK